MAVRTPVRRLLSPTGFLLVACCFLLPFVTVSCTGASSGPTWSATYTGKDLVVGARAELAVSYPPAAQVGSRDVTPDPVPPLDEFRARYAQPIAPQPFMVVVLVLAGLGLLAGALPWPWWRALSGGGLAAGAVIFLIGAEVIGLRAALARVNADAEPLMGRPAPGVAGTGYGFWLALLLLSLLAGGSAIQLVRLSRSSDRARSTGPAAVGPGP